MKVNAGSLQGGNPTDRAARFSAHAGRRAHGLRRLIVPLLLLCAGCAATPPASLPVNLASDGDPAVSGYQHETWVYDQVVITYNNAPALSSRLRLIDRGTRFDGRLGDRDISGECSTFSGLTLELDCRICAAGTSEQDCKTSAAPIAHLRIPLY